MDNNKLTRVPLYVERKEVTDFDMYIYGTKNAEEQEQDFFGKALKHYTDDIGISAGKLAKLTGISKSAVNYYFSGERQVRFNMLIALCLALRLHPLRTEYLFELIIFGNQLSVIEKIHTAILQHIFIFTIKTTFKPVKKVFICERKLHFKITVYLAIAFSFYNNIISHCTA